MVKKTYEVRATVKTTEETIKGEEYNIRKMVYKECINKFFG